MLGVKILFISFSLLSVAPFSALLVLHGEENKLGFKAIEGECSHIFH